MFIRRKSIKIINTIFPNNKITSLYSDYDFNSININFNLDNDVYIEYGILWEDKKKFSWSRWLQRKQPKMIGIRIIDSNHNIIIDITLYKKIIVFDARKEIKVFCKWETDKELMDCWKNNDWECLDKLRDEILSKIEEVKKKTYQKIWRN